LKFRIKLKLSHSFIIFWLLICIGLTIKVQCQELASWSITDEDGLPSMTVYEILQDDLGFIWMGTENGITKYDGQTFKTFSSEKLRDNEVLKVQKDKWNRIWFVNLSGQLTYVQKDQIYPFLDDPNLIENRIVDIRIGGNLMWLFSEGNPSRERKILIYHLAEKKPPVFSQEIITPFPDNYSIQNRERSLSFIWDYSDPHLNHFTVRRDGKIKQKKYSLQKGKRISFEPFSMTHISKPSNSENEFTKIMTLNNGRLKQLAAFDQAVRITNLKVIDDLCWITSTTGLWTIPINSKSEFTTRV